MTRSARAILCVLILLQAGTMVFMSSARLVPAAIGLTALAGLLSTTRFDLDRRGRFGAAVVLAVLFLFKHALVPIDFPKGMSYVASPLVYAIAQFLMALQAGSLLLRNPPRGLAAVLPALGAVTFVCLGDVLVTRPERRAFQAAVAAFAACCAAYCVANRGAHRAVPAGGRLRSTVAAAAVVLAVSVGWNAASLLHQHERKIEHFVARFLDGGRVASSAGFSGEAYLDSVTRQRKTDENAVALRIVSPESPGYLRGRVFDVYTPAESEWISTTVPEPIRPLADHIPPALVEASASAGVFPADFDPRVPSVLPMSGARRPGTSSRGPTAPQSVIATRTRAPLDAETAARVVDRIERISAEGDGVLLEVASVASLSGNIFAPLGATHLVAPVPEVLRTPHGAFEAPSLLPERPFRCWQPRRVPPEILGQDDRENLLELHPDIANHPGLRELADLVVAGAPDDRAKIDAVVRHFRTNYAYRVGISVPEKTDPLVYFLLERPAAHCEYFASGATVLLRLSGVPARFVTGFVALERNDLGGHWVARNRDAHAWVEAYVEGEGWIVVEATPENGVPDEREPSRFTQLVDELQRLVQQVRVALSDTTLESLAETVTRALSGYPGLAVVVLLLAGLLLRRRRAGRAAPGTQPDPALRELRRLCARVDRLLARRRLERRPQETLHRFARRVHDDPRAADDPFLREAADWYRAYADLRYAGPPTPEQIAPLAARLPDTRRLRPVVEGQEARTEDRESEVRVERGA